MTYQQLASAALADRTWLNNSRRLLGRPAVRTPEGARWWGLVRILNHDLGLTLAAAARVADLVLTATAAPHRVRIPASTDGAVALRLDLDRFHSTANAALAAALVFDGPKRRGRPRRKVVRRSGPDEFPSAWVIRVENDPAKIERLASQLRAWEAYPRGIDPGLPFLMDATTLRVVPRLPLITTKGDIDVLVDPVVTAAA
jgi:hypothetical protein